jgi:acetylglutamate kinase
MSWTKGRFYLDKFHNKIFVLKIGGEVIKSLDILENILKDIQKIVDSGVHVVLVHGGGTQADELAKMLNHTPKKINGRRITEKKDLEIVKMLYGGSLNLDILSVMKKIGLKGIRVSGLDGELLNVVKRPVEDIDYGFVGDIENVQPQILFDLLSNGYTPVVSPLAVTNDGTIVNINADTIAIEISISIQAEKLVLFTKTDGVYDQNEKLLTTLTTKEAKDLTEKKVIVDGMAVKIHNCLSAIERGIKRVHIINGLSPHSLLSEVLTKKGVGTMIISNQEKNAYLTE